VCERIFSQLMLVRAARRSRSLRLLQAAGRGLNLLHDRVQQRSDAAGAAKRCPLLVTGARRGGDVLRGGRGALFLLHAAMQSCIPSRLRLVSARPAAAAGMPASLAVRPAMSLPSAVNSSCLSGLRPRQPAPALALVPPPYFSRASLSARWHLHSSALLHGRRVFGLVQVHFRPCPGQSSRRRRAPRERQWHRHRCRRQKRRLQRGSRSACQQPYAPRPLPSVYSRCSAAAPRNVVAADGARAPNCSSGSSLGAVARPPTSPCRRALGLLRGCRLLAARGCAKWRALA
jgi:hypothetical protein